MNNLFWILDIIYPGQRQPRKYQLFGCLFFSFSWIYEQTAALYIIDNTVFFHVSVTLFVAVLIVRKHKNIHFALWHFFFVCFFSSISDLFCAAIPNILFLFFKAHSVGREAMWHRCRLRNRQIEIKPCQFYYVYLHSNTFAKNTTPFCHFSPSYISSLVFNELF